MYERIFNKLSRQKLGFYTRFSPNYSIQFWTLKLHSDNTDDREHARQRSPAVLDVQELPTTGRIFAPNSTKFATESVHITGTPRKIEWTHPCSAKTTSDVLQMGSTTPQKYGPQHHLANLQPLLPPSFFPNPLPAFLHFTSKEAEISQKQTDAMFFRLIEDIKFIISNWTDQQVTTFQRICYSNSVFSGLPLEPVKWCPISSICRTTIPVIGWHLNQKTKMTYPNPSKTLRIGSQIDTVSDSIHLTTVSVQIVSAKLVWRELEKRLLFTTLLNTYRLTHAGPTKSESKSLCKKAL